MTLLLILIYPFAEIYAFYRFIDAFSFWDAVLLVLSSGFLGLFILLIQGRAAVSGIQDSLRQGRMPTNEILHRAIIMLGGLLFVIPGLISDVMGVLCILPVSRHLLLKYFKSRLKNGAAQGRINFFKFQQGSSDFSFGATFENPPERDATVVDITPLEVTHKNTNTDK